MLHTHNLLSSHQVPYYDIIELESIIDACCLRPLPSEYVSKRWHTEEKVFFVNKFAQ